MTIAADSGIFLGDYQLLGELGEGGMGKVYFARHRQQIGLVAVKVPKMEVLEKEGGAAAFLAEIATNSRFQHPRIARVYTSGTHSDGQLYLVMPFFEGGDLGDPVNRKRYRDPKRALALMIELARTVQFAHERLVLHCDLKPANILFDSDGAPHVSDFGLARVIGKPGSTYRGTVQGGTSGWMSPEQNAREDLTAASDVFSLGVMLHWLRAGELPFGDGDDFLARVTDEPSAPRRRWFAGLDWDLQTIRRNATRAQAALRYQTAGALADDLERARDGRPLQAERSLPLRRASKWVRRHRFATAGGIQVVLLLLYVALTPASVLPEVRALIRSQNESEAGPQAGAVMNELRAIAARIEAMAVHRDIRALVKHTNVYASAPILGERGVGFDNLSVFELHGKLCARFPRPTKSYASLDFSFRDYFRTLEQLEGRSPGAPPKAYVSRAFLSPTDGRLHIGFSAPLFDDDDKPVGVLLGTMLARATFGAIQMSCTAYTGCLTALLGARDRDGPNETLPEVLNVVAEPGLENGQDSLVDAATSRKLCAALGCTPQPPGQQIPLRSLARSLVIDGLEDPVSHVRSIAATAAVGGTGLIVLVATPDSVAEAVTRRMIDRVKKFLWIPLAPGLLLFISLIVVPTVAARLARRRLGR